MDKPSEIVRKARKKSGKTQVSFANDLGCTQGTLSKYERGLVAPSANIVIHCMHILSVEEIFPRAIGVNDIVAFVVKEFSSSDRQSIRQVLMKMLRALAEIQIPEDSRETLAHRNDDDID